MLWVLALPITFAKKNKQSRFCIYKHRGTFSIVLQVTTCAAVLAAHAYI